MVLPLPGTLKVVGCQVGEDGRARTEYYEDQNAAALLAATSTGMGVASTPG
jgi:hypothetical protein